MLEDIFEDLDFIANIPKNCKPNFSDKSFTSRSEWFSTLKRRYKYEKGEKGILYVATLIENISNYYKTLNTDVLKKLKDKLLLANLGLNNIIYTYKVEEQLHVSDSYILSHKKIEKLIFDIDSHLKSKSNFFTHCPVIIS